MTASEASELLKSIVPPLDLELVLKTAKYYEAIDIAIKSLEAWEKVKTEIEDKFGGCSICEWFEDYDYEENDISEYRLVGDISDILEIINKYRVEKEVEDGKTNEI